MYLAKIKQLYEIYFFFDGGDYYFAVFAIFKKIAKLKTREKQFSQKLYNSLINATLSLLLAIITLSIFCN